MFFCNSGTEANEACLKFARRYWHTQGATDRVGFVAVENAFAGRTMGALSVTWDEHYRAPFMPLLEPVTFVDPDSPGALAAAVTDRTAAIIAEPIRGEGGIRPLPRAFVDAITDVCREDRNAADRRRGADAASDAPGIRSTSRRSAGSPISISVGKALGSGVPVGAALVSERVAQTISAGDHGSTYGGNLLATRAAAFFLEQLMDKRPARPRQDRWRSFRAPPADAGAETSGRFVEVRGAGLMRGVELRIDAAPVVDLARQRGLLVNRTNEKVVRMLPPLTIEAADIDRGIEILDGVLAAVATEVHA